MNNINRFYIKLSRPTFAFFVAFVLVFSPFASLTTNLSFFGVQIAQANGATEIYTWEDLHNIRITDDQDEDYIGGLAGDYILMNDLGPSDVGYAAYAGPAADDNQGWVPIGDEDIPFTGTFDGGGNTISGLTINRSMDYAGLFGFMTDGYIEDLTLEDIDITIEGSGVGGLVGGVCVATNPAPAERHTSISNVFVTGSISVSGDQGHYVGGLVGGIGGECYPSFITFGQSEASVTSVGGYVGGLIGYAQGVQIDQSFADGEVSGFSNVGGFVGEASNSIILDSFAEGNVSGTDGYVGGFVGRLDYSEIERSYADGSVDGGNNFDVGGFVGYNDNSSINIAYADGDVTGYGSVGGFVGSNVGVISNAYARGYVEAVDGAVGGFGGYNEGQIFYAFSTGNVVGVNNQDRVGGFVGDNGYDTIYSSFSVGSVYSNHQNAGGFIGIDYLSQYNSGWWTGAFDGPAVGRVIPGNEPSPEIAWNEADKNVFKNPNHALFTTTSEDMEEGYDGEEFYVWDFDNTWAVDTEGNEGGYINAGWPYLQHIVHTIEEVEEDEDGEPEPILGCTDSSANNYNPSATQNNGSCTYSSDGGGSRSSGGGYRAPVQQAAPVTIESIVAQACLSG